MKITLTELGRHLLRSYKEETRNNTITSANTTYHKMPRRPDARAVAIDVKFPKIRISEDFKPKYENILSTSRLDTSDLTLEGIPTNLINHIAQSNASIKNLSYKQKESKLTMKFMKLHQKFNLEKMKSDRIMTTIRKKLEDRMYAFNEKEETTRHRFNEELLKNTVSRAGGNYKKEKLQLIQDYKYGRVWNASPRNSYLSMPKRTKAKFSGLTLK